MYTLGLKLGMVYIKDGFTTAKKWLAKMQQQFGDQIASWAPAILETIKSGPAGVRLNEAHAMAITKAVGAKELVKYNWDAVVADESHNLMNNKDG